MRKSYFTKLLLGVSLLAFVGCGGGSSSDDNSTKKPPQDKVEKRTATFYDDPVVGLTVMTGGITMGVTNSLGQFEYEPNKEVSFYVGAIKLGSVAKVASDDKVFLSDLYNLKRGTYDDPRIARAAILLQSLDSSAKGSGKIVLDKKDTSKLTSKADIAKSSFDMDTTLATVGKTAISKKDALLNVKKTYQSQGIKPIEPDSPSKPDEKEITKKCQAKNDELKKFSFNKDRWKQSDYEEYITFFTTKENKENIYCKAGLGITYGFQEKKNYKEQYDLILPAANAGYAAAQNNIGYMYLLGDYVAKNYKKAYEWYLKSANQGNVNAQGKIGYIYALSDYEGHSNKKAYEWLLKAANQGDAEAQANLGIFFISGLHVKQDYKKAYEWSIKSANQGYDNGQNNIGYLYENGYHVAKDKTKACQWYKKSSDQGNKSAIENYNKLCR